MVENEKAERRAKETVLNENFRKLDVIGRAFLHLLRCPRPLGCKSK